jgi:hypothetical protein
MTKEIEILDRLPGCGKTTAIFKYMASNQSNPWLYLSPMKSEIQTRVPAEASEVNMDFFIAVERSEHSEYNTMTNQVLQALQEGRSIACTHNLMLRFTQEHIDLITKHKYNVVCDEELDLIKGYNELKNGDIQYLLENKTIEISEIDGQVKCIADIPMDSRYADIRMYSDMGCLYSAKTRRDFLVLQISPRIVLAANKFMLLTYNYEGSIMNTFMKLHGFSTVYNTTIETYKQNTDVIRELKHLINLADTPSMRRWHKRKSALSATWWKTASKDDLIDLSKAVKSIVKSKKSNSDKLMMTFPKSAGASSKFKIDRIDHDLSFIPYNARATNEYAHKELVVHLVNIYPNQPVSVYMQDMGHKCDNDVFAINTLVQWVFRSRVRKGEVIDLAIFSDRMLGLFKEWLEQK